MYCEYQCGVSQVKQYTKIDLPCSRGVRTSFPLSCWSHFATGVYHPQYVHLTIVSGDEKGFGGTRRVIHITHQFSWKQIFTPKKSDDAPNFLINHAAPCARIKKHYGFTIQKINVTIPTNMPLHATIPTYSRAQNKHHLTQIVANVAQIRQIKHY